MCSIPYNFRTRTPKGDGNGYFYLTLSFLTLFQNTNPERGRKRARSCLRSSRVSVAFQNTNPERGRKLCTSNRVVSTNIYFRTRTPKGDGNLPFVPLLASLSQFQNTNPERGRKRWSQRWSRQRRGSQFQNTNPERGRKLYLVRRDRDCRRVHFRTRTPKGDGNQGS